MEVHHKLTGFRTRLKVAALGLENRYSSWTTWTLRSCWDRRAAEHILGRPITGHQVEEVH